MSLQKYTPAELEEKLYDLANECHNADKAYIGADEIFNILDDNKKSYFATQVEQAEGSTNAEKERAALQSPEWALWLKAYQQARQAAREAKVKRDNFIRFWETCRSILSSRNTSKRTGV